MNVRNHSLDIRCNHQELREVVQALVHSLIFFRTYGKFNYKHEGSYSIGTLGCERVNCESLDFCYVRCASHSLTNKVDQKLNEFLDKMTEITNSATLTVEFYTKRNCRWPFNDSKLLWEIWLIKLNVIDTQTNISSSPSSLPRSNPSSTANLLKDRLLDIIKIVNSDTNALPQMPTQPNIDAVFDTSHTDSQPYLYNISYTEPTTQSTFKKFLRDTLEL